MKTFVPVLSVLLWTLAATGCGSDDNGGVPCGNGTLDPGEECDGTLLAGQTCEDFGMVSGVLGCTDDCRFDTSGCEAADPCGNGALDAGEECDGDNLADTTCVDLGFLTGALSCTSDCRFDTSGCSGTPDPCGNGALDDGEECDGDALGGHACTERGFVGGELVCNRACRLDWSSCGCDDDGNEPNENMLQATDLGYGTHPLVLCNPGGAEDWFAIPLEAGASLGVRLVQEDASLDLDLVLLDESWTILDQSAEAGLEESVQTTVSEAGTVYLQVFAFQDQPGSAGYSLQLLLDPACVVHADCPAGEICRDFACEALACSEDEPCPGDLHCDGGQCVECTEDAHCPAHPMVGCVDNLCTFSCQEDSFGPNDTPEQAEAVANDFNATGLTLCTGGASDWYSVALDALRRYRFELSFAHEHGDINAMLYAADDTDIPVAGGLSADDNETVTHAVAGDMAGTYLLQVQLFPGSPGQLYDLAVTDLGEIECAANSDCLQDEICLDGACHVPDCQEDTDCTGDERCVDYACVAAPPGDQCDTPVVVEALPFSVQDVDITAYRGTLGFEAGVCTAYGTAGKDVFYRVELNAGQTVMAELDATFDAALFVLDACDAEACLTGTDDAPAGQTEGLGFTAPADGSYLIVVDSSIPGDRLTGHYDLDITAP